jgi:hypothetical protein
MAPKRRHLPFRRLISRCFAVSENLETAAPKSCPMETMHAERPHSQTIVVAFAMTAILAGVLLATLCPRQPERTSHEGSPAPSVTTRIVAPCSYDRADVVELLEQIAAVDVAIDRLTSRAWREHGELGGLRSEAARLRVELDTRRLRCAEDIVGGGPTFDD